MDDNFKLNLLIDTIFTANQKFLFSHQSRKMVDLHSESDSKAVPKSEALCKLLNFSASNELERKLLLGILPKSMLRQNRTKN